MFNIVIVGVGGQGTLLASKILGQLAMNNGYLVRLQLKRVMTLKSARFTV